MPDFPWHKKTAVADCKPTVAGVQRLADEMGVDLSDITGPDAAIRGLRRLREIALARCEHELNAPVWPTPQSGQGDERMTTTVTADVRVECEVLTPPTPPFRKGDSVIFNSDCNFVRYIPLKVTRLRRSDTHGSGWSATVRVGPPLLGYYWRDVDAAWFAVQDLNRHNDWVRKVREYSQARRGGAR